MRPILSICDENASMKSFIDERHVLAKAGVRAPAVARCKSSTVPPDEETKSGQSVTESGIPSSAF